MDLGLHGKVALVTGASRGIGKAVAKTLIQEGCQVAICARGAERLHATVADLSHGKNGHENRRVLGISTDVTNEAAVQEDRYSRQQCRDSPARDCGYNHRRNFGTPTA
jgi:3-oxoacyl-[acyl-carrier protein] reductase